jgi:hypothetical protein
MKATKLLHELGQSPWLDNITRDLLDSGHSYWSQILSLRFARYSPTIRVNRASHSGGVVPLCLAKITATLVESTDYPERCNIVQPRS